MVSLKENSNQTTSTQTEKKKVFQNCILQFLQSMENWDINQLQKKWESFVELYISTLSLTTTQKKRIQNASEAFFENVRLTNIKGDLKMKKKFKFVNITLYYSNKKKLKFKNNRLFCFFFFLSDC
jgi:hypothetical protein